MKKPNRQFRKSPILLTLTLLPILLVSHAASAVAQVETVYFPPRGEWEKRKPEDVGMDSATVDEAVALAVASENPATKDLATSLAVSFGREPFGNIIGPTKPRGALNGLIIKNGYVVADWGETHRVDMTFSVTKSFLSTVVGLAWQRGMIADVNDLARDYMPTPKLFESEHNAPNYLGPLASSNQ